MPCCKTYIVLERVLMKKKFHRLVSWCLCLAMVIGLLGVLPALENPVEATAYGGGMAGEGRIVAHGLDVSAWQNPGLDFQNIANAGYKFVILRCGTSVRKDTCFEEYYASARAAGLDVGAYFYSYALSEAQARQEAYDVLSYIEGKTFEYPIYFDMEEQFQTHLSTERRMEMCRTFCELMIENGYFPGVYSNLKWLTNYFDSEELCTYFDVWYARYPLDSSDGSDPVYFEDWDYELPEASSYGLWQYTQSGRIDGVSGNVDLNIAYKDYPALIKKYGFNGY